MGEKFWLVCATSALVLVGGCVSEESFREVIQQAEKERSKNEQLLGEVARLKEEISGLNGGKAALQNDAAARQTSMDELMKQIDSQAMQIKSLSSKSPAKPQVVTKTQVVMQDRKPDMAWAGGVTNDLKQEFGREIAAGSVRITQTDDRLTLSFSDVLLFEEDDVRVSLEGEEILARLGGVLKKVKDRQIVVSGHLDTTPIAPAMAAEFPTAWEFTGARAVDVVRFLEEESKLSGTAMSAVAYGSARPVAANATEVGRARNRRIDMTLLP
jgi:chemotaxis protein MotB